MIVMMGLVPACSESSDGVRIGANAREASLVEIWEAVVGEAGAQDTQASLSELSLWLGEDGKVDMLHFIFYARDAKGHSRTYFVQSNYDGDVTCYRGDPPTPAAFGEIHPLSVFEELDKVPLTSVQAGHESFIDVSFVAGDMGYGDAAHPYLLKDGELLPLKEVIFHTSTPWAEIQVVQRSTSVQHWFLSSELDKADSVEYA
jgi:hypothetical protein